MFFLAAALSLLIGLSLGLLGGGGSMLTVPILIYVLGIEAKSAIATSLLIVGVTSAAGVVAHARAGRVHFQRGILFGAAGMVGAYAGGRVAHHLPARLLLLAFAAMMIATAAAMLRGRAPEPAPASTAKLPIVRVLIQGVVVGGITGLVGAGGGFLVVPALALWGGLPMAIAIGTSLLVIAMQSLAGFAGYLGHVAIDMRLATLVGGTAIIGILIGGQLAGRVPQAALRKGFGWFVLAMALFLIGKQIL